MDTGSYFPQYLSLAFGLSYIPIRSQRRGERMINKEMQMITRIAEKLYDKGSLDEVLVVLLETALEDNLRTLQELSKKDALKVHEFQDYVDALDFSEAIIKVLRYFTTDQYSEEEVEVLEYADKHMLGI